MPAVLDVIDKMSVSEKVSTIIMHSAADAPAWHEDVLEARRRKIESGEAEFLTIEESEALLDEECHAR